MRAPVQPSDQRCACCFQVISDHRFQRVQICRQLRYLPRECPRDPGGIAGLEARFIQDAVDLGLDLLLGRKLICRGADGTGIIIPHLCDILCHAGIVHKNAVLVLQALGRGHDRVAEGVARLSSVGSAVLERGHDGADLRVVIAACSEVLVGRDGVRQRHEAVGHIVLQPTLRRRKVPPLPRKDGR